MQCRSTRASLLLFVIVALHGLVTVAMAQEISKELWGNWRITKKVSTSTISCWGETEARAIIGTGIEYTTDSFRWKNLIARHATAEVAVVSAKQFHDEHSGQGGNSSEVTFSQLGITTAEATLVKIKHPAANVTGATTELPGDVVLMKDENTIIFSVCNVYFVAERVSAPNSETATARSNSAPNSNVSVEPWETLVHDTVTVNAGQALEYQFQLESGTELLALFQVQGGHNDRIRMLLLDDANYQLFASSPPIQEYPILLPVSESTPSKFRTTVCTTSFSTTAKHGFCRVVLHCTLMLRYSTVRPTPTKSKRSSSSCIHS